MVGICILILYADGRCLNLGISLILYNIPNGSNKEIKIANDNRNK